MTFEARMDAIALNLGLTAQVAHENEIKLGKLAEEIREIAAAQKAITATQKIDGEHIRTLARIAEIHGHRLTDLEGGEREN